jgi:hypothetical protein
VVNGSDDAKPEETSARAFRRKFISPGVASKLPTFFRNGRDRLASFDHHATTVFYLAATRSNYDQFTRVRWSSHMVYKSPYSLRSKIRPIAVELNVTWLRSSRQCRRGLG